MAIIGASSIKLYNLSTHCNFNLFNGIEYEQTQSVVETIKVNDVFKVNIFASEVVFGALSVFLKRISVSKVPIVADIEQISGCLTFIIENKSPLF